MHIIYLILLLVLPVTSNAATKYVGPSGSASWANCNSTGTLCSLDTAMANAVAGDIIRVTAGSYSKAGSGALWEPAWNPVNSGSSGNMISFQAYPEGATVNMTISSSSGPVIGTNGSDSYIHYKGFTVSEGANYLGDSGTIAMRGAGHNLVEDCEVIGRYRADLDNHDGVRIDFEDYTTVRNCYIRGYSGLGWNSCGVKLYRASYTVVEYCTLYNNSAGIWDKQGNSSYNTYRYNLFDENGIHFKLYTNSDYPTSNYHDIHNNVFLEINGSLDAQAHNAIYVGGYGNVAQIDVYNNTIYNSENADGLGAIGCISVGPGVQVFNNIVMNVDQRIIVVQSADISNGDYAYEDYNQFYNNNPTGFRTYGGSSYSLSGWNSNFGFEAYAEEGNPNFDNPGGSSADDYKRSSYPTDGRGGAWSNVIGAWISDTNPSQIGHDFSTGDSTPPVVTSALISTSGTFLTVSFNEVCSGNNGLSLTAEYGAANLTYSSGSGTARIYSISREILAEEAVTLNYSEAAGNILDLASNEMTLFSGGYVSNNSQVTGLEPIQTLRLDDTVFKADGKEWLLE